MDTKLCRFDNTPLIIKKTKNSSGRAEKKYYYSAYYFCPTCKRIFHDETFKVENPTTSFFNDNDISISKEKAVEVWTDGACTNNGTERAKASWGFVVGSYEEAGFVEGKQTNNRGEGLAIYHALLWALKKGHRNIKIHSDSQITLHGVLKHPDKVKENRDIFQKIYDLVTKGDLQVEYIKVKGHSTDINNVRADKVATSILLS